MIKKQKMKIVRNILAVIIGIVLGSVVNMSLINISSSVIPPPNGVDVTTFEGLSASMHLFEPKHFLMPFLAHTLGTFVGAIAATLIAATHKLKFALSIGFLFLIGGTMNVFMLPSPLWFSALDLIVAYIPMAFIAAKLVIKKNN
jgi:hypothetical protein